MKVNIFFLFVNWHLQVNSRIHFGKQKLINKAQSFPFQNLI